MSNTPGPSPPGVRLRRDKFETYCAQHGLRSLSDRADFIGVHFTTVGRIMRGDLDPGTTFIATATKAFGVGFDDLFEITTGTEPDRDGAAA
jgi:transcriptional regulator with XRE-family HTH domain